jgi:protein arginine N-methyltransferase 5
VACARDRRSPGFFTGSDTVLESRHWTTSVVGKLSPWLNLDSSIPQVRKASEKAFAQEMAWASHLSVPAIMLPTPAFNCFNYSASVNRFLAASSFLHVRSSP